MKSIRSGLILLVVQVLLVLSVAGKYLYERQTRPRLWVRATQFDPSLPLRGRYLALQVLVDSSSLPHDAAHLAPQFSKGHSSWTWNVSLSDVRGKLMPNLIAIPWTSRSEEMLTQLANTPCDRAILGSEALVFIPDRAQLPLPLKVGQDLWVEVTLPPSGPPRPIQVAISDAQGFQPLRFN